MYLIHNDPLLYDHVHEKRVECRALNIPEELGQVQYMFCDKVNNHLKSYNCLLHNKVNGLVYLIDFLLLKKTNSQSYDLVARRGWL